MTDEEFKSLKEGDRLMRMPVDYKDDRCLILKIKRVHASRRELVTEVMEVVSGTVPEIPEIGSGWQVSPFFADRYFLYPGASAPETPSPVEPEKHIAGLDREVINFDAGRELCM